MNKFIIMILFTITVSLQYKLWFKEDGIPGIKQLSMEIKIQHTELNNLRSRNQELVSVIKLIKRDPRFIEEHARVMFGMVKDSEVYYRIIE